MDSYNVPPNPNGRQLAAGESWEMCPYNAAHVVLNHRYWKHVLKCRKAYAEQMLKEGKFVYMRQCRYYRGHVFPEIELPRHEEKCLPGPGANGWAVPQIPAQVPKTNPDTDDEEEEKRKKAGPTKNELLLARAKAALKKEEEKKMAKANTSSDGGKAEESEEEEEDWELEGVMDRLRENPDYVIPVFEGRSDFFVPTFRGGYRLTPQLRSVFKYPARPSPK